MKYLKSYKIFESISNIDSIVQRYISDSNYDLENSLGNCAFFAKDFFLWCKKNGLFCKLIYLKQDESFSTGEEIEDHIIVGIEDYLIDFVYSEKGVSRRVRVGNPDAIKSQTNPLVILRKDFDKYYPKFGYHTIEEIDYEKAYGTNGICQTIDSPIMKNDNSIIVKESIDEFEDDIELILLELSDSGLQINTSRIRKDVEIDPERYFNKTRTDLYLEIYISRPWNSPNRIIPGVVNPEGGYPGNLLFWYEIRDSIIRLTEWYYSTYAMYDPIDKDTKYRSEKDKSPLRFFGSGIEMYTGFDKADDFKEIGDFISFTNFRIMIKV